MLITFSVGTDTAAILCVVPAFWSMGLPSIRNLASQSKKKSHPVGWPLCPAKCPPTGQGSRPTRTRPVMTKTVSSFRIMASLFSATTCLE